MLIGMSKGLVLAFSLLSLLVSCVIAANPVTADTVTQNSWAELSPMHQARSNLGVGVVNGRIYAIGGNAENGVVSTNEEYQPNNNTWVFKEPMPIASSGFATAVYEGKIYCISGNVNEVYDSANDSWETKTPMPTNRTYLQANVVNGLIYLIGGEIENKSSEYGLSYTPVNEVYNPATDSWATKKPMPVAISSYGSVVINNRIYIVGSEIGTVIGHNEIYDPETDTWYNGSAADMGGIGGATTGVFAPARIYYFYDSAVFYDPFNDTWGSFTRMPSSRFGFAVAVLNDRIYTIGGVAVSGDWTPTSYNYKSTYVANVEEYTPFGYGTVPPIIFVTLPESTSYVPNDISLNFITNKPVTSIYYSLDGQQNVTVVGNVTLTGLSSGKHSIQVYANDTFGNMGVSEVLSFSVLEPFPVAAVATVLAVVVIAVVAVVVVFLKRRR